MAHRTTVRIHWFFAFFLISGFCSLIYEVVWLRLAMARFGVTTPLTSIVLSIFMAGLGLGSIIGGRLARRFETSALFLYGLVELLIGVGGLVVPAQLGAAYDWLRHGDSSVSWGSGSYHLISGTLVALVLLPWCTAMGATYPLAMSAIRHAAPDRSRTSFSFLYLANVLGAILGTLAPAFVLIELLGFRGTLWVAASLNGMLGVTVVVLHSISRAQSVSQPSAVEPLDSFPASRGILVLLFATGLCSMAMEVIWIRLFTVYLGNVVYAFAMILAVYLAATFAGSWMYRRSLASSKSNRAGIWIILAVAALLPLVAADPWLLGVLSHPSNTKFLHGAIRAAFGIAPFSALLGFVTPQLVDDWSSGSADRAGRAYAVNVCGAILGPLIAGFWLLPAIGEHWALFAMAATLGAISAVACSTAGFPVPARWIQAAAVILALTIVFASRRYESRFDRFTELRDHTATVIATGEGMDKSLLVNGVGMTKLTTITKVMTHLPLASLNREPHNGLVICFGMGTSFRSMLSWGISSTVIELVPSVPKFFGYFHADGDQLLQSPLAHVVIDDGRRFLDRTNQRFDVIVIDPPPPPSAPASSLLYSRQFYDVIRRRLAPDGILQIWYPAEMHDRASLEAVATSIYDSFPHVRAYRGLGYWGVHFLASLVPLPDVTADGLAARLPARAAADLMEWTPDETPAEVFGDLLNGALPASSLLGKAPVRAIDDDRPINEYYWLRSVRIGHR